MEQIPILFTNQSFSVCSTVHVLLKVKKNFQKFHCIANKGQFLKKKFSRKRNTKICRKFKILQNSFCKACVVHFKWKKSFDISWQIFSCSFVKLYIPMWDNCLFVGLFMSNPPITKLEKKEEISSAKCLLDRTFGIWHLQSFYKL